MLMLGLFAASPEGGTANPMATVMMMMGFIAIFYFLFFRPQRKQQQEHQKMVQDVKKGDEITTVGGIVGTIVHLTDDRITIKTGDTKIEVERSKIGSVRADGS
ncbi:MAG: preprotein translocase subunit YajC [Gemmatimonadetes bacterium]|nr:preprotein translocase subunit YajC [Gemmatimonadota bacterium]